ncbi:hypothetical protein BGZ51_002149 [Haplosporangium sp. Z 767]|nr:hypothetical protein BGZ51_002149 [Haplosporangium sp. Z 767]KAF9195204.1 hypothetical protein BGZ50_005038 [Haplosporangium sp. Z 11]
MIGARLIRNFTRLQSYIAPVIWSTIPIFGVFHNPTQYNKQAPLAEGQAPPILSDAMVMRSIVCFALIYMSAVFRFFVRTGVITREYKRHYSYEGLFENMNSYVLVDGGKCKIARFELLKKGKEYSLVTS